MQCPKTCNMSRNRTSNAQKWHRIKWRDLQEEVFRKQQEIEEATREERWKDVLRLQERLILSFAGRAIAVLNVSRSSGSKTPGMDHRTLVSASEKWDAIGEVKKVVESPSTYSTAGVKRVWIPKGNGEKRPLGIPTVIDRCAQALIVLALDPTVEANADIHSYGFRKGRGSAHAMTRIRNILDKGNSPRWILDADIAKCFDNISHEWIMNKLACQCCGIGVQLISKWLTASVHEVGKPSFQPERGTPQGGVISPLLANMALDGLERSVRGDRIAKVPTRLAGPVKNRQRDFAVLTGTWVVRYADDFIITCRDRDKLEGEILERVTTFLAERGMTLSEKKTKIVDLKQEGFKFLGWHVSVRNRDPRRNSRAKSSTFCMMKPTPENIKKVKLMVSREFDAGRPIDSIVRTINPKLRGWTNYFRTSYHSQEIFQNLQNHVFQTWKRWAKKRYPTRTMKWKVDKFITSSRKRKWLITAPSGGTIYDPSTANEWRVRPLKNGVNWYGNAEYFAKVATQIDVEKFRKAVYAQQSFKCAACMQELRGEAIELHHIIPKKDGGEYSLKNIVALHKTCHVGITNAKVPVYPHLDRRLKKSG